MIYDENTTQELDNIFKKLLLSCKEFDLNYYDSRSLNTKFIDGLSRLLSSIL